jgi:hypothetical protein
LVLPDSSDINIDPKRKNVVDKKINTGMFYMKSLEAELKRYQVLQSYWNYINYIVPGVDVIKGGIFGPPIAQIDEL